MRFRSIWTMPGMSLGERLRRTRDLAAIKIGRRLPLRIRYWVAMMEIGYATKLSENVPATPLDEVLSNLRAPKNMS